MKVTGTLVWFGHQWSGERSDWGKGLGVVIYAVKMYLACGLMLKKKLLPPMIELVVILNHLRVINL